MVVGIPGPIQFFAYIFANIDFREENVVQNYIFNKKYSHGNFSIFHGHGVTGLAKISKNKFETKINKTSTFWSIFLRLETYYASFMIPICNPSFHWIKSKLHPLKVKKEGQFWATLRGYYELEFLNYFIHFDIFEGSFTTMRSFSLIEREYNIQVFPHSDKIHNIWSPSIRQSWR